MLRKHPVAASVGTVAVGGAVLMAAYFLRRHAASPDDATVTKDGADKADAAAPVAVTPSASASSKPEPSDTSPATAPAAEPAAGEGTSDTAGRTSDTTNRTPDADVDTDDDRYTCVVVELPFPASTEVRLRNMLVLRGALQHVKDELYVLMASPGTSAADILSRSSPSRRTAHAAPSVSLRERRATLLTLYDDVFQLQVELGCPLVRVVVHPVDRFMGLSGAKPLLMMPQLQAYIGDGSADGYRTAATASESRRAVGLPVLTYVSVEEQVNKALRGEFALFEGDSLPSSASYSVVVTGGTFDRLHIGHRKLLTISAMLCEDELVVGITDATMLKSKADADIIQPFHERAAAVEAFVGLIKPGIRVRVERLLEPFGPTTVEAELDALVVSTETLPGAAKINEIREARGFRPLAVIATHREHAGVVSSSYLRERSKQLRTEGS